MYKIASIISNISIVVIFAFFVGYIYTLNELAGSLMIVLGVAVFVMMITNMITNNHEGEP